MRRSDEDFRVWMKQVDAAVVARIGLSVYDLPDCCFRDWFDAGVSVRNAAARAIANAKDEDFE